MSGVSQTSDPVEYGARCRDCGRLVTITLGRFQKSGYIARRCRCGNICDLPRSFASDEDRRAAHRCTPSWFVDDPDVTFEEVVR